MDHRPSTRPFRTFTWERVPNLNAQECNEWRPGHPKRTAAADTILWICGRALRAGASPPGRVDSPWTTRGVDHRLPTLSRLSPTNATGSTATASFLHKKRGKPDRSACPDPTRIHFQSRQVSGNILGEATVRPKVTFQFEAIRLSSRLSRYTVVMQTCHDEVERGSSPPATARTDTSARSIADSP